MWGGGSTMNQGLINMENVLRASRENLCEDSGQSFGNDEKHHWEDIGSSLVKTQLKTSQ